MIQYLIYKRVPKDKLEPLFHLFGGLCIFAFVLALLFQENKNWGMARILQETKDTEKPNILGKISRPLIRSSNQESQYQMQK